MSKTHAAIIAVVVLIIGINIGCSQKGPAPSSSAAVDQAKLSLFEPLPEVISADTNPITEEKVALGRMLFYETRLSKSQQISCNSCHDLSNYGVDGQATSDGHKGQRGNRNSPSVYNAAGHFAQFWDGRAKDVEAQAKGPVLNPVEMAMASEAQVIAVLKSIPGYADAFKRAFPDDKEPVTYDNMAKAIGAFERKLTTPSRWDKFQRGDQTALTAEEKAGFNTFVETGCHTCHAGKFVGGNLYQKLGAAKPWPDTSDPGRQKATGNEADSMLFKVPSLRNVEKTGPFYHTGKVTTLEEAVSTMADYQLGKSLSPAQVNSIVVFLKSLTGEIPADYIKAPVLPKGSDKTPKPDMSD